jgi:hypothetical protein
MSELLLPLTEDWLREVGFRWHELERQPSKHWLLWLGTALVTEGWNFTSFDDLGIELASGGLDNTWFCWLRSDAAGRYHRFIHTRHMRVRGDVIRLVVALTDLSWEPKNHLYGCVQLPQHAEKLRLERERMDQRFDQMMLRERRPWYETEKDESRGRALPEHLHAAIEKGGAK